MKSKLVLVFLAATLASYSQDENEHHDTPTYLQFDLSVPLRGSSGDELPDEITTKEYWFMPDGIAAKFGIGVHHKKWLAAGIHTGIEFKGSEKLVAAPIFLNLRIAPKVNDEFRIYAQLGYGHVFAIGRGDMSGTYKKASIGIESDDELSLFIELSQYGFRRDGVNKVGSLSVGISHIIF